LELKLDFSYGERKAPNGHQKMEALSFIDAGNSHRLVPCMAFFGANASGKTNIIKALALLKRLVMEAPKLAQFFDPNLLNPKFSETTFVLEFVLNRECFEYRFSYNAKEIFEEVLTKNGSPLYTIKQLKATFSSHVISDSYPETKLSDILKVECSDGEGRQTKPFLNCIARGYRGLNSDLSGVVAFFDRSLSLLQNNETVLLPIAVQILASTMDGDQDRALLEITDVVRRLDIDIAEIEIFHKEIAKDEIDQPGITRINQATGAKHVLSITTSHKDYSGKLTVLDFIKHESDGTQRLAGLVGIVLYSLKIGGVLLVDELECSLHPLLIREIVMLFKTRRHNPKGAQLIFATHNTDILDDTILRISEIALVKKTLANGTLVRRLVDLKNDGEDIRNVTNFRKQYLAGFYSGVPHPAL